MYVSLSWGNQVTLNQIILSSKDWIETTRERMPKYPKTLANQKKERFNVHSHQAEKLVSKSSATGRHFTGLSESGFSNLLLSCTCCYLFDWGILPCQHSQDLGKVLCKDSWNTMKCQRWQVAEISCAKIAATGLLDLLLLFSSPLDCFWHLDSVVKSVCGSKYFMPHSPAKEQRCHI